MLKKWRNFYRIILVTNVRRSCKNFLDTVKILRGDTKKDLQATLMHEETEGLNKCSLLLEKHERINWL